jgi:hypothetical protein
MGHISVFAALKAWATKPTGLQGWKGKKGGAFALRLFV